MAHALRRHAGRHLQDALARLSSTTAASQQPLIIPAEVAALVSQTAPGLAVMPPDVVAAVDAAAADANRKAVKRRGQELSYRLRAMSRSQHRGGVHPNLSQQLAGPDAAEQEAAAAARRQRRGKRRQSRHAALEQLTRAACLPVDAEGGGEGGLPELQQLLDAMQREVSAEEAAEAAASREAAAGRTSIAGGGSLYDPAAALAYAAARMPACYAALEAALGEVAARRPGWRPACMLDFGAGPATAVWAAQRVWRQSPLDALAVEPAAGMAWLGGEIQARQRQAAEERAARKQGGGPAGEEQEQAGVEAGSQGGEEEEEEEEEEEAVVPPPRLRWMYKLPPRYGGTAQGRQYDLVTAAYVLGELRGEAERRRCVAELWQRTAPGGVLLLVEPGTPSGAGHIQRARSQLLEAAGEAEGLSPLEAPAGQGAHVVAPCPHDGRCPLESRAAWCHFVQRFQRTQLQRNAKASAGIQPRTYQDERYAYVAVARAPRPGAQAAARQPWVAGSRWPDMSDPQEALRLRPGLQPRKVAPGAAIWMRGSGVGEGGGGLGGVWTGEDEEAEQQRPGDPDPGSDSESWASSSSESDSDSSGSLSSSESESGSESDSDSEGEGGGGWARSSDVAEANAAAGAGAVVPGAAGLEEATRRLLLESVLDDDDDDDEGADPELAAQLRSELGQAVAQHRAALEADGGGAAGDAAQQLVPVLAPVSQATADLLFDGEAVDWEAAEPAAVAAAAAASGGWSRVVRQPRKRGGHVLLDVCSAGAPDAGGGGVLLRQVVSRQAARRDAGGLAPYRLARRLRWGDLWPHYYQQRFRAEEPPAAAE